MDYSNIGKSQPFHLVHYGNLKVILRFFALTSVLAFASLAMQSRGMKVTLASLPVKPDKTSLIFMKIPRSGAERYDRALEVIFHPENDKGIIFQNYSATQVNPHFLKLRNF